ncbi:MAG TPA: hypothetical protein PKY05_03725, partial [Fibrobacteria bacterium]|nr:hypothetical protein [Fibrobacteria bacterium]
FDTISNSNSSTEKMGDWEVAKNLDEYASATDLGEKAATIDLGIKAGIEVCYKGFSIDDTVIPVAGKLELAASVFTWKPDDTGHWKSDFTTVSLSINLSCVPISIPLEGGEFKGTVAVRATGSVVPNWRALLPYLVKRFPCLSAITFDVLMLAGVIVGFVALLVCAYLDLKASYDLQQLRDVQIPQDSEIMITGFEDGLYDRHNHNIPMKDADVAVYRAGQDIGERKRKEAIEKGNMQDSQSLVDEWLRENGRKEVQKAKVQLPNQMRKDLWLKRANDTKDPEDQYWSWIYICGDCPASRADTSWLDVWMKGHVPDSNHPNRDRGSW